MRWMVPRKCLKRRFKTRDEAYFWGPPYRCNNCGQYHITHIDRKVLWGKLVIWLGVLMGALYVLWVLLMIVIQVVT